MRGPEKIARIQPLPRRRAMRRRQRLKETPREKERVTDEEMQEQYEQVKYRFCFNTYFQAVAPVIVL